MARKANKKNQKHNQNDNQENGNSHSADQTSSYQDHPNYEKLKLKFDKAFGEDYLEEHGNDFETLKELRVHWRDKKKELREERKEKRQEEREEKREEKRKEKQNEEAQQQDDNGPIEFDAASNTYSVSTGVSAEQLNTLMADAAPGAIIILEDGTHEFSETITISRDDITLKGQSEEGTILNFTFAEGTGGNAIEVTGGGREPLTTLETHSPPGSNQIVLADVSGLSVGDVIYIAQPNTEEYLLENGWTNVSFEDADDRPFREMMVRIEAIDGNTITLASDLAYEFEAGVTQIFTTDLLENVNLQDFTVTSGIDLEPNYNDFTNPLTEFLNTSVILIQGADGIELSGISILDAPSSAFDFRTTIDLIADNLYVNGAHNMGTAGNGYGVNLYETFDATITDIEIFNVRHAVLFSSWNAEVGNYIEVTETNRDINFHGSPDMHNEVVVLRAVLEYDPEQNTGSGNGFWDIVSGGGSRHANIDMFAFNDVVFAHAEGSTGTEIIYGADVGSYLDGGGSQDLIIGGAGNDIIIGGTSQDVLTGGGGADIFAFTLGDSYDVITDFSSNAENDRILISGNPEVTEFEDLYVRQQGEDVWITYGASSTIILTDFDVTTLDANDFIFS
jgi:Ca2+-binding RTX toxin-like protein